MRITLEEMRDIAKRLPIGYYLGMKVPVTIEPDGAAYCDIVKRVIHIGMPTLQIAADNIDAADAAAWDRETLLRCLLYHEVGHLLMTPAWLKHVCPRLPEGTYLSASDIRNVINIFEDERLESILAGNFLGVDFKKFVRLVNKGGTVSGTAVGRFYDVVRLRKTTPELSEAVDDAIASTSEISATTDYYDRDRYSGFMFSSLYEHTMEALLGKVFPPEEEEKDKDSSALKPDEDKGEEESQPDAPESGEPDSEPAPESDKDEGDKDKDEKDERNEEREDAPAHAPPPEPPADDGKDEDATEAPPEPGETVGKGKDEDAFQIPRPVKSGESLQDAARRLFVEPDAAVANTLRRFASRLAKRSGAQSAGRWSALHGRIDVRRDALDKERIFRRASDVGDSLMSSVNLVLWIDTSGSFSDSEDVLNAILVAVAKAMGMSGGRLSVQVVKMDWIANVAGPNDWQIDACGGNCINRSYHHAWEKTRAKGRRNIDIVVFDGDAKSDGNPDVRMPDGRRVEEAIWNHPDCHIISDTSNRKYFRKLKRAHVTYITDGYAERLQDEVLKTLDRIL